MKLTHFIFGLLVLAFVLGCAKPPVAEMNSAKEAVARAENDADAALYGGNSIVHARDALNRMQAEANSKHYEAAKNFAAEAETAADTAIAAGRAGAARARDEAAALVANLLPVITETEQELQAARSARLPLDFNALTGDFDTARRSADQAQVALSGNRYQDALEKGRSAQAGLGDIKQKLAAAATAASRKK